eukprot:3931473-Prymnesium_polylepis.1
MPPATRHQALHRLLLLLSLATASPRSHFVALHDYTASEPDELSFSRGDKLVVVSVEVDGEEGWGVARSEDGTEGLLPLNYVRLLGREPPGGGGAA